MLWYFLNFCIMRWNVNTDVDIDLVQQIGGDGFDSLKQVDVGELLADKRLTDIDVPTVQKLWIVKRMISKKVLYNSVQNKLMIHSTKLMIYKILFVVWTQIPKEHWRFNANWLNCFPNITSCIGNLKTQSQSLIIPCSDRHFYCVNRNKRYYWY